MFRAIAAALLLLPTASAVTSALRAAEAPRPITIVEAHLSAPDPSAEGAWLVEVDEVLSGEVRGSVLAVDGLPAVLLEWGAPDGRGERLRLVLAAAGGGRYRVLSGHVSPVHDPALDDPLPPPLATQPRTLGAPGEDLSPRWKAAPAPSFEQQVVELVNQERWNAGQLPPLKQVDALHTSSETHSSNMATRNFFAHCDPDTKTQAWDRMTAAGYPWIYAAENLAVGQTDPADVMTAWMTSPGHLANILSLSSWEIGVGYVLQSADQANVRADANGDCTADTFGLGPYFRYWTQNFGRRANVYPVVIEREAHSTGSRTVDLYVYGTGFATQMRFSNDGSTWSAWQPYQPDASWTLTGGEGWKTVYAQIRNGAGTIRQSNDRIYLVPCPAVQNLDLPNHSISSTQTFEACDTISAVQGFTVTGTGDVTFRAGERIILGDGFRVLTGGSFRAVIETPQ